MGEPMTKDEARAMLFQDMVAAVRAEADLDAEATDAAAVALDMILEAESYDALAVLVDPAELGRRWTPGQWRLALLAGVEAGTIDHSWRQLGHSLFRDVVTAWRIVPDEEEAT